MLRGISLANKVQLLFTAAVLVIVSIALIVPWVRTRTVVDQSQLEATRQIARLWRSDLIVDPTLDFFRFPRPKPERAELEQELSIRYYDAASWAGAELEPFEAQAREVFAAGDAPEEYYESFPEGLQRRYRYALRITGEPEAGAMQGVLVIQRVSDVASAQVLVNRMYLVLAGFGASIVAIGLFYYIVTRVILRPVRELKGTADLVKGGDLSVRSDIKTGDEFEQLSDAFNAMLGAIVAQQTQLRGINRSLDLKLTELAERNVALYESMRMKSNFLANVSHELRTPLNSIIGFAELLQEIADRADEPGIDAKTMQKRRRYLDNIVNAGRTLLEMINELLTMARLDAGTVELHVGPMDVVETCEGLMALIRPLADRKRIGIRLQLASGGGRFTDDPSSAKLPVVQTDAQKYQQIVFNFLSNAVKFTPEEGEVILRAEILAGSDARAKLRVSVLDTGPGIPAEKRAAIFEKFTQLETGHTKGHQGTGLGLAIAKEFAEMLEGEIQVESEEGSGSMFSLMVPLVIEQPTPETEQRAGAVSPG